MRTGVIAKKLGMTRFFDEAGVHVPVTVLRLDGCQVTAQRTKEKDGYVALQLGAGAKKAKNTPRRMRGHFAKALVEPKRKLAEFRVTEDNLIDVGAEFTADHFLAGQKVDIQGVTVGKGFAGGIKRWNFGGLRATHGVSRLAPLARLDRPAPGPGQGVQEQEDGRPPGPGDRHHPEPHRVPRRRRARPDPGQGRGARRRRLLREDPRRDQEGRCPPSAPKPGALQEAGGGRSRRETPRLPRPKPSQPKGRS